MNNAFALRSVRLALSLVLPFIFPSLLNAASYENFEGPYTVRNFNVHYYTNGRHRVHSVRFPHFDALVNKPPQNIHCSIADFSAHSNVSTVAQIRQDPVNARNHALWLKATCCVPGQTGGRNEMHFRKPYDSPSMPNGMTYTFAMRFNVESLGTGTIMQGFSKFPWLRLMVRNGVNLYLNLAQCK